MEKRKEEKDVKEINEVKKPKKLKSRSSSRLLSALSNLIQRVRAFQIVWFTKQMFHVTIRNNVMDHEQIKRIVNATITIKL